MDKDYIGDGVYVEIVSGMIRLHTLEDSEIFLEPEVYRALVEFATRIGWKA